MMRKTYVPPFVLLFGLVVGVQRRGRRLLTVVVERKE
jgi:hypothetical protein